MWLMLTQHNTTETKGKEGWLSYTIGAGKAPVKWFTFFSLEEASAGQQQKCIPDRCRWERRCRSRQDSWVWLNQRNTGWESLARKLEESTKTLSSVQWIPLGSPGLRHINHLSLLRGERVAPPANSTYQTHWPQCFLPMLDRKLVPYTHPAPLV